MGGAALRELNGGQRKRDLKRAFAIVEKTGAIHFVIAGSDAEYLNWVVGIKRAIRLYSTEKTETLVHVPMQETLSLELSSHSMRNGSNGEPTTGSSQSSNRDHPLGRTLSRVVQAAKVKGQAVVARDTRLTEDRDNILAIGLAASLSGSIADSRSPAICESGKKTTPTTDFVAHASSDLRRNQIRNRFAGVGQATKSRFGSALSAAKQIGKDVAQKRRTSAGFDDPFIESTPLSVATNANVEETWICAACTFINSRSFGKCRMCEFERSQEIYHERANHVGVPSSSQTHHANLAEIASDDQKVKETEELIAVEDFQDNEDDVNRDEGDIDGFHVDDQSAVSDLVDDDEFDDHPGPRFGIKQRFGAVVRKARKATLDSQRFSDGLRTARQGSSGGVPSGAPNPTKLNKIGLGGPLQTPIHPFGEGGAETSDIPLKKLEGVWSVRVNIVATPDSQAIGDAASTPVPTEIGDDNAVDSSITAIGSASANCDLSAINYGEDSLVSGDPDNNAGDDVLGRPSTETLEVSPSSRAGVNEEMFFQIHVIQQISNSVATPVATTVLKTLPDIAALHTSLSEAVAKLPSYAFDIDLDIGRTSLAEMNENFSIALGLTTLDTVRLTGRLLGGLLDISKREPASPFPHTSYHGKIVKSPKTDIESVCILICVVFASSIR